VIDEIPSDGSGTLTIAVMPQPPGLKSLSGFDAVAASWLDANIGPHDRGANVNLLG
jgi:hypothetical protein